MYSLGEQIHVAAWPGFSLYRGAAKALGPEVNNAASLVYAVEGQTFVLAPCAVVGTGAHQLFCDTDMKKQLLLHGGGFARIYGPRAANWPNHWARTRKGSCSRTWTASRVLVLNRGRDAS
jgi:nitrilase